MVTSNERSAVAPDIPSAKESGLDMDMHFWLGFSAPAGTPAPTLARLHKDMVAVLALPDVKKRMGDLGFTVIGSSAADAEKLVASETQRWAAVIKVAGIKVD
jgi:tripartite-type tricarboxylate transporter receptor subunit TctC